MTCQQSEMNTIDTNCFCLCTRAIVLIQQDSEVGLKIVTIIKKYSLLMGIDQNVLQSLVIKNTSVYLHNAKGSRSIPLH